MTLRQRPNNDDNDTSLLGSCALIVGTTMLIRLGKARYAWVTAVPGLLVYPIVMWAGYLYITGNFMSKQLYLLAGLSQGR